MSSQNIHVNKLYDIYIMRPVLIVILVFYHAFAISNGAWDVPTGYSSNTIYSWLASFFYSFMLESFVFMSGYVYSFQCIKLNKNYTFWQLLKKKSIRLLIPFVVFGIIYVALFYDIVDIKKTLIEICWGGIGHLWFLPMLFWCFILCWLFQYFKVNDGVKLLIAFFLALIGFVPLPFRMKSSLYYFFYFFTGFLCFKYKPSFIGKINKINMIPLWIIYAIFFTLVFKLRGALESCYLEKSELLSRSLLLILDNLLHIMYSIIGTLLFWLSCITISKKIMVNDWLINVGGCCFGVYILQQFILKYLYYYTEVPQFIPSIILPWFGFVIALLISYLFSVLLRKNKVGKFLIG